MQYSVSFHPRVEELSNFFVVRIFLNIWEAVVLRNSSVTTLVVFCYVLDAESVLFISMNETCDRCVCFYKGVYQTTQAIG